jgi:hypothetical protein
VDDFLIARNPDESSTLPYLLRLPLTASRIVLEARDTWPRTAKVYCHTFDLGIEPRRLATHPGREGTHVPPARHSMASRAA